MNTYSHVLPALKNDAAMRMNTLLAAKPSGVKSGVNPPEDGQQDSGNDELLD
jgi:hypothetical protein